MNKDEVIETGLKAEVEEADDESDAKENMIDEKYIFKTIPVVLSY